MVVDNATSSSICGTNVIVDNNITVAGGHGFVSVLCKDSNYTQPTYSSTTQPVFVNYMEYGGVTNNMQLSSGDTVAKDHGVSLSTWFAKDKNGVSRPQGSSWDIGAYEFTGKKLMSPNVNFY
jgi:hypothetical protein